MDEMDDDIWTTLRDGVAHTYRTIEICVQDRIFLRRFSTSVAYRWNPLVIKTTSTQYRALKSVPWFNLQRLKYAIVRLKIVTI